MCAKGDELLNDTVLIYFSKYVTIEELNISHNRNVSDMGIKNMMLHTLYSTFNDNITKDGTKHMQLRKLLASWNTPISDIGIKLIKLDTLLKFHW